MWYKICNVFSDELEYQIDYDEERGMYRVSIFKDDHFQDDFVFDEVEK